MNGRCRIVYVRISEHRKSRDIRTCASQAGCAVVRRMRLRGFEAKVQTTATSTIQPSKKLRSASYHSEYCSVNSTVRGKSLLFLSTMACSILFTRAQGSVISWCSTSIGLSSAVSEHWELFSAVRRSGGPESIPVGNSPRPTSYSAGPTATFLFRVYRQDPWWLAWRHSHVDSMIGEFGATTG